MAHAHIHSKVGVHEYVRYRYAFAHNYEGLNGPGNYQNVQNKVVVDGELREREDLDNAMIAEIAHA